MTPFSIPTYDAVDPDNGVLPSEDWHDFTWTAHEPKLSKNTSAPMMVIEFTIDNGIFSGIKLSEYIVFGTQSGFGEAKLKKILESDGTFQWEQKPTLEEFSAQFPAKKLRAGGLIKYDYQIKGDNGWETVPQDQYNAFTGQKSIKAQIVDFRPPTNQAHLKFQPVQTSFVDDSNLPF